MVPHEQCFDVKKEICVPAEVEEQRTECVKQPVEKCRMDVELVCKQEPETSCKKVPRQTTRQECKLVPTEVDVVTILFRVNTL